MNGMRAVDTNVLVRLITRDDARQAAAADIFIEKGAWVSTLALAETMWVLTTVYGLSPANIATAIDMLLNHQDLTLQDSERWLRRSISFARGEHWDSPIA